MTTPSPAAGSPIPPATAILEAWQQALAAEHASIFGYGTLGPRLPIADQPLARTFEKEHRAVRDAAERALAALGVTPVSARADYPPPLLTSATTVRQSALRLETSGASAWRFLLATAAAVSGPQPTVRSNAQANLTASAIRAMRWRLRVDPAHPTEAFPGI